MVRALHILSLLVGLLANLIPLAGVLYWGWDTFQLLMLYWMETAILAFWTLLRLSRLDAAECGTMTVNGKVQPATPFSLAGFFAIHSSAFILGHLLFLWVFFSSEWLKNIHSVGEFFYGLFVAHGIWAALLLFLVMHAVAFLANPHPLPSPRTGKSDKGEKPDTVGGIIAALYIRIVVMQVAIIFGALFSGFTGSLAPLLIVMVLKTLSDLVTSSIRSFGKLEFSSGKTTTSIET
jgi:uncharacterized protein DUF6498